MIEKHAILTYLFWYFKSLLIAPDNFAFARQNITLKSLKYAVQNLICSSAIQCAFGLFVLQGWEHLKEMKNEAKEGTQESCLTIQADATRVFIIAQVVVCE